jgi:predicted DCC family thiol-disulfide oxidoreductase YuxK
MAPILTTKFDIILFDGVCNFCNRYINYIIMHDKDNKFVFAPVQSNSAHHLAALYQIDLQGLNSIVVVHDDKVYTRSDAVIHIIKNLNTRWLPLAYLAYIIPPFIRNYLYTAFANKRYALFGQAESCVVPTIHIKSKFLT